MCLMGWARASCMPKLGPLSSSEHGYLLWVAGHQAVAQVVPQPAPQHTLGEGCCLGSQAPRGAKSPTGVTGLVLGVPLAGQHRGLGPPLHQHETKGCRKKHLILLFLKKIRCTFQSTLDGEPGCTAHFSTGCMSPRGRHAGAAGKGRAWSPWGFVESRGRECERGQAQRALPLVKCGGGGRE